LLARQVIDGSSAANYLLSTRLATGTPSSADALLKIDWTGFAGLDPMIIIPVPPVLVGG
jgi:hypothetical protein